MNASMEVMISEIPAAQTFSGAVHIVRSADDVFATLARLRTCKQGRRNTAEHYGPITWSDRAGQIIEVIQRLPKFRRLVEQPR
jgi:hypothetical protein